MTFVEAYDILENPKNVRFSELLKVTSHFFGDPRIKGSHHVFKVPWPGEPFVNLQSDGKMAKDYQVRQVVRALKKLEEMRHEKK